MSVLERPQVGFDSKIYPFVATCDQPKCYWVVSSKTYEEAVATLTTHPCPHLGGPTRIGILLPKTILEEAWVHLDTTVDAISAGEDVEYNKARARGIAEILAMFMGPHFRTPDEVSREAGKRLKARRAGEPYETPGLGVRRMEMPEPTQPTKVNKPRAAVTAPNLGEKEKAGIKAALDSGLFKPEQLAATYKVDISIIQSLA